MNPFFENLGRRLAAAAATQGITIDAPRLDNATAEEILDLARVAAHTQERRFAPLAAYLAGVAAERTRSSGRTVDAAAMLRQVKDELEAESPAAS